MQVFELAGGVLCKIERHAAAARLAGSEHRRPRGIHRPGLKCQFSCGTLVHSIARRVCLPYAGGLHFIHHILKFGFITFQLNGTGSQIYGTTLGRVPDISVRSASIDEDAPEESVWDQPVSMGMHLGLKVRGLGFGVGV